MYVANFPLTLIWLLVIILHIGCSRRANNLFSANNDKNISVSMLKDSLSPLLRSSCICEEYFDNTVRISKRVNSETELVREQFAENFYGVGQERKSIKVGVWQYFCDNKKVIESFWQEGGVVWIKSYDGKGKLLNVINFGLKEENF